MPSRNGSTRTDNKGADMRRGTTPTNTFNVDTDLTEASVLFITYSQLGKTVIEKTLEDATITPDDITVNLTQAETLELNSGIAVEIQIRAGFKDGSRIASNIMITDVSAILKDGVI